MDARNVIVIGSGPAGHTAGIYAARANLEPLMFEGAKRGGQLMITNDVENYPGFPRAVSGPALMEAFREQSIAQGVEIAEEEVTSVDLSTRPFAITAGGAKHFAKALIVATGAQSRWLGLESEQRLHGHGVSACAVCDGAFFRDEPVIVVGGGDTAMEEAMYLSGIARSVTLVHRRASFRASQTMQARVLGNEKIRVVYDATVDEVLGTDEVTGARVRVHDTTSIIPASGFFVAIGHTPNTSLFKGAVALNESGYIVTKPGTTQTSVPGVFAAGDVQDFVYRQAVTAAGSGCMAALEAERWLSLTP
jgi:thioredoxin reductase (NADPH)